jgi:hypothetical protein
MKKNQVNIKEIKDIIESIHFKVNYPIKDNINIEINYEESINEIKKKGYIKEININLIQEKIKDTLSRFTKEEQEKTPMTLLFKLLNNIYEDLEEIK